MKEDVFIPDQVASPCGERDQSTVIATAALASKFRRKQLVVHLKTGGAYRIVHTPETCRLEASNEPAYAYQAVWIVSSRGGQINLTDKPLWVRGQTEMEDGRFSAHTPPADGPLEGQDGPVSSPGMTPENEASQ